MKYGEEFFKQNLTSVIKKTDFRFGKKISGKVRDSYVLGDYRLLVATDRLSAFDVILSELPFKGEILTKLSLYWFEKTKNIFPNHIEKLVSENAIIVKNCKVVPLEVIVRGYLTGSLWRAYKNNETPRGITLPAGLKEFHRFSKPLVCFTTKAELGEHDEPISHEEIISKNIIDKKNLQALITAAENLFEAGNSLVAKNGLILVDTKYEFGFDKTGNLLLVDEVHTQDSSRYILKEPFEKAGKVEGLDKEYFRKWLMDNNYNGNGNPPPIPDHVKVALIMKYYEAYKLIAGSEPDLKLNYQSFHNDLQEKLDEFIKKKNIK